MEDMERLTLEDMEDMERHIDPRRVPGGEAARRPKAA
jgi:hypothetical protein